MQEYGVMLPIDPLVVGGWVDRSRWPLHVTLVPNVVTPVDSDLLVDVLRQVARTLPVIVARAAEPAWFGPEGDVRVRLLHEEALAAAHREVLAALRRAAPISAVEPRFLEDSYRAHVTVPSGRGLRDGAALRLDSVALIEIAPAGDREAAVPVAQFDLGDQPLPAPTTGGAAIALLHAFRRAEVRCWVIGGWGVDALLGEQTREHHDLDVFIHVDDLEAMDRVLGEQNLALVHLWSENRWIEAEGRMRPSAFVAHGPLGALDVHVIDLDGDLVVPLSASDRRLTVDALDGTGTIGGHRVRCASAQAQLVMHEGYELPEDHRQDVERLRALR